MAVIAAAAAVATISVTALASNNVTMTVNGATVHCAHERTDMWDYNPFQGDSVTATATADAAMDYITTTATIYYATGSENRSKTCAPVTNRTTTECSATVTAEGLSSSYGGGGSYRASHNGNSNSTTTKTYG